MTGLFIYLFSSINESWERGENKTGEYNEEEYKDHTEPILNRTFYI